MLSGVLKYMGETVQNWQGMANGKNNELIKAAKENDVKQVFDLIDHGGVYVSCQDSLYRSPLHYAALNGNYQMIDGLLERGARIDLADSNGKTPLHLALENGKINVAIHLIEKGASLLTTDKAKRSAKQKLESLVDEKLFEAVKNYAVKGAAKLIDHGLMGHKVKVNCVDKRGNIPLYYAMEHGDRNMIHMLLERGDNEHPFSRETPLHLAARLGRTEIVKDIMNSYEFDLDKKDAKGQTAMSVAMKQHNNETFVFLLSYRYPDPNLIPQEELLTLLADAARAGNFDVLTMLFPFASKERIDYKLLLENCVNGHLEHRNDAASLKIIHHLIGLADNLKLTDFDSICTLICKNRDFSLLGAILPYTSKDFRNPIVLNAVKNQDKKLLDELTKHGLPINVLDSHDNNVLHLLVDNERIDYDFLKTIIRSKSIDPRAINDHGKTPYDIVNGKIHKMEGEIERLRQENEAKKAECRREEFVGGVNQLLAIKDANDRGARNYVSFRDWSVYSATPEGYVRSASNSYQRCSDRIQRLDASMNSSIRIIQENIDKLIEIRNVLFREMQMNAGPSVLPGSELHGKRKREKDEPSVDVMPQLPPGKYPRFY